MSETHVSPAKKKLVKEFKELITKYPIIAVVNMENLPAKQLQTMRTKLRDNVELRMAKRRLIKIALESTEKEQPGVTKLAEYMRGMPALLFTSENPFSLFKTLKKNKSTAPIKAGQVAPNDIVVPAGPTGFAPGPIIGELGGFGIKSGIDAGKVVIKEDSVVAKEGEEVSSGLAGVLTRLGIEPMQVGLDLLAAYEDGEIVTKSVLDIDEDQYIADIISAATQATNLSFNSAYPTKETITLLLSTAAKDSLALALDQDILTDETAKIILAKAQGHADALNTKVPGEKKESAEAETKENPEE